MPTIGHTTEMGTNKVLPKAPAIFLSLKALRKMRNLIFLYSGALRNSHYEFFNFVEAQRNLHNCGTGFSYLVKAQFNFYE